MPLWEILAYKGKVERHVLLTKNEWCINSNYFHKFLNILMKLERNTETKYSMQVMPTATTKTTTAFNIINFSRVVQYYKPLDKN